MSLIDIITLIGAVVTLISVVVAAVGVWFLVQQVRDARRFQKAQFISELERDIADFYDVYTKLLPEQAWHSD